MFTFSRDKDTICAVSTPPGHGAIAVVRLSGAAAIEMGRRLCPFLPEEPESHRVYYGLLQDPESKQDIDEVLVSFFQKGRSFTGEATLEISTHGSPALSQKLIRLLLGVGARLAERGEFTYRAFMNGRIDLVQAESVLALIQSQNEESSGAALRQLKGDLSREFSEIEDGLTWILSRLEANIDFSAEDIEIASGAELLARAQGLQTKVRALLSSYRVGRVLREGIKVAVIGAPNVGKSSLLNALAGFDRAIVSEIAGTTRDTVEAEFSLLGQRVVVVDTAGLREATDSIESLGIERSRVAAREADVILHVRDLSAANDSVDDFDFFGRPVLTVWNKLDVANGNGAEIGEAGVRVSAKTGAGLDALREQIAGYLAKTSEAGSNVLLHSRHFEILKKLDFHLGVAVSYLMESSSPEVIIAELNECLISVYQLLGRQFDDEVMDRVFREFCLGK